MLCSVELGPGTIVASAGTTFVYDFHSLTLEWGGFSHDTLYIRSEKHSALLVIRDEDFIREFAHNAPPEIKRIIKGGAALRKKRQVSTLAGWSIVLLLFIGLFFSPLSSGLIVAMIPLSVDQALGKAAFAPAVASMAGQYRPVDDPKITKALQVIQQRLENGMENRRFQYRIQVFDSPLVNAVALPGGYVAVFSGLIQNAGSPEELAGVIAHELSHVERRHGMKQIIRRAGFFLGVQLLLGGSEGLPAALADGAALLANLNYSRSMENQADEDGALTMIRTGVDPVAMVRFFEENIIINEVNGNSDMQESDRDNGSVDQPGEDSTSGSEITIPNLSWLSTHPDTNERIENILAIKRESEKNNAQQYKPLPLNWRAVQNAL